jgi:hypothetical protein
MIDYFMFIAANNYAKAYNKDAKFYSFYRSLESYKKSLLIVLSQKNITTWLMLTLIKLPYLIQFQLKSAGSRISNLKLGGITVQESLVLVLI